MPGLFAITPHHPGAVHPGDRRQLIAYDGGVPFPHPPAAARAALDRLIAGDPDLAGIEVRAGPLPWRTRSPGYPGLLQAIVAQQISNQAAAAIWGRLRAVGGALEPAGMLALSDDVLRAAGLSRPKVAHARALAAAFLDRTLDADAIAAMDDETAVATIAAVRGLGAGPPRSICCSRSAGMMCSRPATSHSRHRRRT